jgi:osmoprotectant transport system permease protein
VSILAEPFIQWSWIFGHGHEIWSSVLQHLVLTVIPVAAGLAISVPLGMLAQRHRAIYPLLVWVTGLLYTIPSLALFVLLIPITGLSLTTVEIGLTSYTLLILIRNVVIGLDGVPVDVKEAAAGMGLTQRQIRWRVEVPLAFPAIMAGIRVATVSTIGLVTVGAIIGRGGLGQFILDGLQILFTTEILLGAVLSVVLAVLADGALLGLQRALTPWTRAAKARAIVHRPMQKVM